MNIAKAAAPAERLTWLYRGDSITLHRSEDTPGAYWIGDGENRVFLCVEEEEMAAMCKEFLRDHGKSEKI